MRAACGIQRLLSDAACLRTNDQSTLGPVIGWMRTERCRLLCRVAIGAGRQSMGNGIWDASAST